MFQSINHCEQIYRHNRKHFFRTNYVFGSQSRRGEEINEKCYGFSHHNNLSAQPVITVYTRSEREGNVFSLFVHRAMELGTGQKLSPPPHWTWDWIEGPPGPGTGKAPHRTWDWIWSPLLRNSVGGTAWAVHLWRLRWRSFLLNETKSYFYKHHIIHI